MTVTDLIRDLPHAPYIEDMSKVETFVECDEVLRSKDFVQGSHRESTPFIGGSLIVLDRDAHFDRRRMEAALFTRAALEHYERETLVPHIDRVIEAAARGRDSDGIVRADLTLILRATLARITATITGLDGVDDIETTERFISYVEQLNKGVTVEWSVEDHDTVIERTLRLRDDFVEDFFSPSLVRRKDLLARYERGELSEGDLPRDLLMLLLRNPEADWDDELMLRESTLFYAAATQTTTHAAPHVIRHLAAWFDEHPEDGHLVRDGNFLKASAYESLRLHVPVHALLRIATSDVELTTGRRIRKGERVACCFAPANRDVAVFGPDAASFNPHRSTEGSVKPWGLSFGGGPHVCIGRTIVTGLSASTDGTDRTEGMIARILLALYAAGIELDSDDPAAYVDTAHVDAYARFPVRFTNL